jgi:hypothetical protein
MKTRVSLHQCSAILAFAAALASAAACNSSDTVTGPPSGGVGQSVNLAGTWTGTYWVNDDLDCDPTVGLDASAAFQQNYAHVRGPLTVHGPCGLNYIFEGEVRGNTVNGTIPAGSFHGTASGVLSDGTLRMVPVNSYGWEMGTLTLRR